MNVRLSTTGQGVGRVSYLSPTEVLVHARGWVSVHDKDLTPKLFGEPMSEVHSYRGLSHATLLVSGHDD